MNFKLIFFIPFLALIFAACTPGSPVLPTPANTPSSTSNPTATLSPTAALTASATPTALPLPPTPQPIPAATHAALTLAQPQFDAVPLGKCASLVEGEASFSFCVRSILIGQQAASKLFKVQVPSGLQWVIVIPEIIYDHGPANQRVQLVHEDLFNIISKGQVLKNDFMQYTPVSNHLNSVTLLPGETSQGYLVFAVYQDDDQPVLRYESQGKATYFALTKPRLPAAEALPITPAWFGDQDMGSAAHPVALGKTIAYDWNGSTLLISVERMLHGINARKELWAAGGGQPAATGDGQENMIVYLHIHLLDAPSTPLDLKSTLFNVYNQGQPAAGQPEINCPMPCLNKLSLYVNGDASGWLPLVTAASDPQPVLGFNNELFFALTDSSQVQSPRAVYPAFAPDAIGPNTIKNVKSGVSLQQHSVVQSLAFSPDNKWLASGGDDHKIHIWDTGSGDEITTLTDSKAMVKSVSFSYDQKWLASANGDETVMVWNTANWKLVQQFNQGGSGLFAGFLADGSLVSVNQAGFITTWDITGGVKLKKDTTQKNISPKCNDSRLNGFDMTFDGSIFAAALDCGYGVVWDANTQARLVTDANRAGDSRVKPYTSAISLSQIGGLAAYGGSYYHQIGFLVDISDISRQLVLGGVGTGTPNIPAIAFAPSGEIVAAGIGSTIRTWWPDGYVWTGRKAIDLKGHAVQVTALKFSTDAALLASGDYQGHILIWKASSQP